MRRRASARGWTLVDMMVTLICMAMLYFAVPTNLGDIERARAGRARADAVALYNAQFGTREVNGFYGDVGRFSPPASAADELVAAKPSAVSAQNIVTYGRPQVVKRGATAGWRGPYTGFSPPSLATDPWNRPWSVDAFGRVTSAGLDGVMGSVDDVSVPSPGHATLLPSGVPDGELEVVVMGPDWPVVVTGLQASVQVGNVDGAGNYVLVNATPPSGSSPHFRATGLVTGRHAVIATAAPGSPFPTARAVGVGWVSGRTRAIVRLKLSRECCEGL